MTIHTPPRRATTASSAKNRAVVALTTLFPSEETTMAAMTLTALALSASTSLAPRIPIALPPVITGTETVLALDLGTATGWALRGPDGRVTSGTITFRSSRFEGGGMRYLRFQHWLREMLDLAGPIERIVFEEVRRHVSTDSSHVYGGLLATLTAWSELNTIPYQGVPVGTIKRFATGRGNADKTAVIAAIRLRGFNPSDDNEADALAILLWAIETQGGVA
jgi:Holliday junction resolvasome RuvABC endonuclease subunit